MDAEQITMLNMLNTISNGIKQSSGKTADNQNVSFADMLNSIESDSNQNGTNNYLNLLLLMSSMNNQALNSNSIISSLTNNGSETNDFSSTIAKLSDTVSNLSSLTAEQKDSIKSDLTKILNLLNKNKLDSKDMSSLVMLNFLNTALKSCSMMYSQDSDTENSYNIDSSNNSMSDYMSQIVQLNIDKILKSQNSNTTNTSAANNATDTDSQLSSLLNDINRYFTDSSSNVELENTKINTDENQKMQSFTTTGTKSSKNDTNVTTNETATAAELNNSLDLLKNSIKKENPSSVKDESRVLKNIELIKSIINTNSAVQKNETAAASTDKSDNLYDVLSNVIKNILVAEEAGNNYTKNHNLKTLPIKHPDKIIENVSAPVSASNLDKQDSEGLKDNNLSNMNQNAKQSLSESEKALKILNSIKQSGENESDTESNMNDSKVNQFMNMLNNLKNTDNTKDNIKIMNQPVVNQKTFVQDFIKTIKYMENNNVKNLTVKIEPKELGELVIKLTTENGIMKANITATTKEGYYLLNSSLADMSNQLSNGEVKIQQLSLSMYDSGTYNQNQPSNEENRRNYNRLKSNSFFFDEDDTDENADYSKNDYNNLNILV